MFRIAMLFLSWGATQVVDTPVVPLSSEPTAHSPAASPDAMADERLSVAFLFDASVLPDIRRQLRESAVGLRGLEIQPEPDTERLLASLECSQEWLSCQILAGRKLGVEKLVLLQLLSSDALQMTVVDVRLEASRGFLVVPWVATTELTRPKTDATLISRLRTALLVLLRETPVFGELWLRGITGRVRIDGLERQTNGDVNAKFSVGAGTHLLEVENEEGHWSSSWVEIPGEGRLELSVPTSQTHGMTAGVAVDENPFAGELLRTALISAGAITTLGCAGFWSYAAFVSGQPVAPSTSSAEVKRRLELLEWGQQSAWILGVFGLASLGIGTFLEFWPVFDPSAPPTEATENAEINR